MIDAPLLTKPAVQTVLPDVTMFERRVSYRRRKVQPCIAAESRAGLYLRSKDLTELKIAAGALDVQAYLGTESLGCGKALFASQPIQKCEAEGCFRCEFQRLEVEKVRFNGVGIGTEGGTIAGVGDTLEGAAFRTRSYP